MKWKKVLSKEICFGGIILTLMIGLNLMDLEFLSMKRTKLFTSAISDKAKRLKFSVQYSHTLLKNDYICNLHLKILWFRDLHLLREQMGVLRLENIKIINRTGCGLWDLLMGIKTVFYMRMESRLKIKRIQSIMINQLMITENWLIMKSLLKLL